MVSLESTLMTPESTIRSSDEGDATHQAKLAMLRGNTVPSVLSKRLNKKLTMEAEGTSTTDTDGTDTDGSRPESDRQSDASNDGKAGPAGPAGPTIDFEGIPDGGVDACNMCFMSPDPFDFMPSGRMGPAFSDRNLPAELLPMKDAAWQSEMYDGSAPGMQLHQAIPELQGMPAHAAPPMPPPAMHQMAVLGQGAPDAAVPSWAKNTSPGPIMVPYPVPMPMHPAMQFSMQNMQKMAPPNVQVPPGFKLVRIPEKAPERKPEPVKSAISDPANTDRKIFVGGLNPITTGQSLREYFMEFGPVLDAKVIREGERSKGFGFVQFRHSIPPEVLERTHIIDQRRCGVGPAFHDGAK
jgi:hypothetical protein